MSIYSQVQKKGKEAGCPVAGYQMKGIEGSILTRAGNVGRVIAGVVCVFFFR